jgi:L-histidine N-alpha-methyltransferase
MPTAITSNIEVVDGQKATLAFSDHDAFALDVLVGLSEAPKSLPSKYMYDAAGSELFAKITGIPEYYLTQCEIGILESQAKHLARCAPKEPFHLVEFGAGSYHKPAILIEEFLRQGLDFEYVPIDISKDALEALLHDMSERFPDLKVHGLVTDYFTGIRWLNAHYHRRNFVLFLGSNIGNFTRSKAHFFLRNLWNGLNDGDHALIGFDLRKDIELLLAAYNDKGGVTSRFNLNLLHRINSELGGHFDVDRFRHFGTYNVFSGAMESYLVGMEAQTVTIDEIGRSFEFQPWEPIHTEYSYKYLESDIDLLASATGFRVEQHLSDAHENFIDSHWRVQKDKSASQKITLKK